MMNDIFSQMASKAGRESNLNYGMSGEMKKTQYVLELIGSPCDADTLKCVITAAEQGMEMNCYSIYNDKVDGMEQAIAELSPFGITPCLKEANFTICGSDGITSFIDARGLGYALTPRNATLAALQNYWVDIAVTNVAPHVENIVEETIVKVKANPSYVPDEDNIKENLHKLEIYFDALEQQLHNNKYIVCDKYTWADLHWTAYIHLCVETECGSLITQRQNILRWFERIKSRRSQCGQDIVAYDLLPNITEIEQGRLKSVEINDY